MRSTKSLKQFLTSAKTRDLLKVVECGSSTMSSFFHNAAFVFHHELQGAIFNYRINIVELDKNYIPEYVCTCSRVSVLLSE